MFQDVVFFVCLPVFVNIYTTKIKKIRATYGGLTPDMKDLKKILWI
jgi:hypothetical protein